jgi:hypothetical protein
MTDTNTRDRVASPGLRSLIVDISWAGQPDDRAGSLTGFTAAEKSNQVPLSISREANTAEPKVLSRIRPQISRRQAIRPVEVYRGAPR